jgi:hypothetical protein
MKLTDDEFVMAFENLDLGAGSFGHREHVRLAWVYLNRYPAHEALPAFANGLKKFAAHLGAADKYHETITWAYLALINERIARSKEQPDGQALSWEAFSAANRDLFEWPGGALGKYYKPSTLDSDLARHAFLMPDRVA